MVFFWQLIASILGSVLSSGAKGGLSADETGGSDSGGLDALLGAIGGGTEGVLGGAEKTGGDVGKAAQVSAPPAVSAPSTPPPASTSPAVPTTSFSGSGEPPVPSLGSSKPSPSLVTSLNPKEEPSLAKKASDTLTGLNAALKFADDPVAGLLGDSDAGELYGNLKELQARGEAGQAIPEFAQDASARQTVEPLPLLTTQPIGAVSTTDFESLRQTAIERLLASLRSGGTATGKLF